MTETLVHRGSPLPGHFLPGPPGSPSLVLIHEYWGLNAHIKDVARRYAAEGFTVFAIDLYGGKLATDESMASELMTALDWKIAVPLVGDALEALRARDPKTRVGVTGFCMGGAISLSAAAAYDFVACVPFYGI